MDVDLMGIEVANVGNESHAETDRPISPILR